MDLNSVSTHSPFNTPIHVLDLADMGSLNDALAAHILAVEGREAGLAVSNRGGWHSTPDLALREGTPYKALCDILAGHFRAATEVAADLLETELPPFRLALTAWAMIMRAGHYATLHDHAEASWSSVYYVDPGDPPPPEMPSAGALTFVDPRRGASAARGLDLFPGHFDVTPRAGRLVIFPGYLQHHVHPYLGRRPRISIAANVVVQAVPQSLSSEVPR